MNLPQIYLWSISEYGATEVLLYLSKNGSFTLTETDKIY